MRTIVAALALIAAVSTAFARANLVSATPNGMAMPPPTELRLKFSEGVDVTSTKVTLTGTDNKAVNLGAVKPDPADSTAVIVPIPAPLPDGTYTVNWQTVGADGQKAEGAIMFESMP